MSASISLRSKANDELNLAKSASASLSNLPPQSFMRCRIHYGRRISHKCTKAQSFTKAFWPLAFRFLCQIR